MMTPMTWSRRPAKWLYITAILELALAGVFVLIGLMAPVTRGGMWATAGILGLVGLGLLAWANKMSKGLADADRLRETGIKGQARVVSMEQTGMSMNDNPLIEMELEVTLPGRQPYRVHHKEWVPLMMLGTLGMGAALPVLVDPQDPSKVLVEWNQPAQWPPGGMNITGTGITIGQPSAGQGAGGPLGGASGVAGAALGALGLGAAAAAAGQGGAVMGAGASAPIQNISVTQDEARSQQLLSTGLEAQASVTALQDTGVSIQGRRLVVLDLIVNAPGRPPQTIKHPAMVPEANVAKVVQGATLPVRVNGANPSEIAIDWART